MNEAETRAEHRAAGKEGTQRPTDVATTETQRLESLCQRKLAALAALKQSLLHQAFSGQL